jgi:hypothetical protein
MRIQASNPSGSLLLLRRSVGWRQQVGSLSCGQQGLQQVKIVADLGLHGAARNQIAADDPAPPLAFGAAHAKSHAVENGEFERIEGFGEQRVSPGPAAGGIILWNYQHAGPGFCRFHKYDFEIRVGAGKSPTCGPRLVLRQGKTAGAELGLQGGASR